MEAPQYRGKEALQIAVHPNALRGDIRELSVLDQYIGVHIPPTLPQFSWLPAALIAGAVLGLAARLLPAASSVAGHWRRGHGDGRRSHGCRRAGQAIRCATSATTACAHTPLVGVSGISPRHFSARRRSPSSKSVRVSDGRVAGRRGVAAATRRGLEQQKPPGARSDAMSEDTSRNEPPRPRLATATKT